jgi:NADH-quinone oxidoreductase subunit E
MSELKTVEEAVRLQKVWGILDRFDSDPGKIIPILQAVQEEYRYLPEEVMILVASALRISPAKVFGIATFYSHFSLEPKGKYIVRVCDGTACHVKGSGNIIKTAKKCLGLSGKEKSTPDLLFTLETVSCLGACGLAPVVVINDQVYGQMDEAKMNALIEDIRESEKGMVE